MALEFIKIETHDAVAVATLHRPDAHNKLNNQMMCELGEALLKFDSDPAIGAMIITGGADVFSAGADVKEMQAKTFAEAYRQNFISADWETVLHIRKPVIAAVSGYAMGGGCELAMMCDFILASETARFGQPEINWGVMPGVGGSQRLTRFVGKSKAMEMCLSGRTMEAEEAERSGLISRIIPKDDLLEEAIRVATKIAEKSVIASMAVKEAVNRAYETPLSEGVRFERRLFHALFSTEDQVEGMEAVLEQRAAQFRGK